jgi:hypothetical protein
MGRGGPIIDARVAPASSLPPNEGIVSPHGSSPCLSDFEAFLTKAQEAKRKKRTSSTEAYWENILVAEKKRLEDDLNANLVAVEDIMVGASSEQGNLPIVATLPAQNKNLSMLASVEVLPDSRGNKSAKEKSSEISLDV